MRDPYTVLGIAKTAGEKEIKAAYRALAKKYHPDSAKGAVGTKEKFAEIGHAYDILGDKEKRGQFDRGEIDGEGKPRFQGFAGTPGSGSNPFEGFEFRSSRGRGSGAEDILSEIFGGRGFRTASGAGASRNQGSTFDSGGGLDIKLTAEVCVEDMARGKASVHLSNGKQLAFSLPAGATDGQAVRLAGQGRRAPGVQPGDALVTLRFIKHNRFELDGTDIRTIVGLPLRTAVGGGKVAVETLDGKIALSVPPFTDSGKVFRLKGKGLPAKTGGHGDMLVVMQIRLPAAGRDSLAEFFSKTGEAD